MKKVFALLLALMMAFTCMQVIAEENTITVYVTIANGNLCTVYLPVAVTDIDGDGALTINDTLYCAHEAAFEGGAEAGYASVMSDWGLFITKLWGVENGGSYGYYLNDVAAMSLTDTVADEDYLNAWVYTDTTGWSDTYCFIMGDDNGDDTATLYLCAIVYDENYAPVTILLPGAHIIINGEVSEYVTDENGSVIIPMTDDFMLISAYSEEVNLVPPAFIIG